MTNGGGVSRHSPIRFGLLLLVCVGASSVVALLRFPYTLDDAYITFHYARNFALEAGLGTWNIGEPPVEGYSSLFWTLLLGWGLRFHLSSFYISKALGYLATVAMPATLFGAYRNCEKRGIRSPVDPETLACAAILLALYLPQFYYSVTGMETTLFSFEVLLLLLVPIVAAGTARTTAAVVISLLLTVTRPEGVFLASVVNGYWLLRSQDDEPRGWAWSGLLTTLVTYSCLSGYRILHFGEFLPNPYYAKAEGGRIGHRLLLGVRYVLRFLQLTAPAGVSFVVLWWRRRRANGSKSFTGMLLAVTVFYTAYIIKVGGDPDSAFALRRHFIHIAPVLALALGACIARASASFYSACRTAVCIGVLTSCWIAVGWCARPLSESVQLVRSIGPFHLNPTNPAWAWLARYSTADTLSAVTGAGEWPYYVPGRYIDMLGLNDAHIARFGRVDEESKFQDAKSDVPYVLSREPDIIEGYMPAKEIIAGICPDIEGSGRAKLVRDFLNDSRFQNNYVFIVDGPYSSLDRALFFRANYLRQLDGVHPSAIAVTKTVLGSSNCR